MLSALFHPHRRRKTRPSSNFSSIFETSPGIADGSDEEDEAASDVLEGEDAEQNAHTPLLPIFAAHLDSIPVYNLVHAIRSDVVARCDTTLTWDQLRTPQVSSFLVKPILSTLLRLEDRLAKGLLYSLMANCLQFRKEAQENPANSGTSSTRAYLCEMLAIKCLKEYSTRELIDALSYDFYPLQGMTPASATPVQNARLPRKPQEASRISALEIAIRAQAKKFLSHPVVIQQLEAIWAGNVVFHSLYDQLHRAKDEQIPSKIGGVLRRSATLYGGEDATPFKLSRLRVPRYRHILSTCSLTILLLLHLRVLMERSYTITPLELLFWLWSSGFMIDEIIDIGESGVSLYLMSLWNTFDVGIFMLFVAFYVMRILGLARADQQLIDWSYDVLASCSVFLFPRIFSVLDHYRYFSQLIIAFRIMAVDMLALLVIIVVSCSGFFVAFTLSFARDRSSPSDILYALFQILMGYTPAAWEAWSTYNLLGKFLLTTFLIICHFLIVTILITVLTNSFAAVAANAQEEHQFLVAVNTISLVKNESLFTYVAPLNLMAWILHPLRYFVSFKKFIRINRLTVKITHFPILMIIYLYERQILRKSIFDGPSNNEIPTRPATLAAMQKPRENESEAGLFSPVVGRLRRRSSMGSNMQARVLEEVFRTPFRPDTEAGGNVDSWMNGVMSASPTKSGGMVGNRRRPARRGRGRGAPPMTRNYGTIPQSRAGIHRKGDFSATRSVISDPEDFAATTGAYKSPLGESEYPGMGTDDDADNEENSADEADETVEEDDRPLETVIESSVRSSDLASGSKTPQPTADNLMPRTTPPSTLSQNHPRRNRPSKHHARTHSSSTVLFRPFPDEDLSHESESSIQSTSLTPLQRRSGTATPGKARSRAVVPIPPRLNSVPDFTGALARKNIDDYGRPRGRSISGMSELLGGDVDANIQIPSSFATQMAMAAGRAAADNMLNHMVLARMGALEECVKDLKEMMKEAKKSKGKERRPDSG